LCFAALFASCLQVVDLVQTLDGGRRNMYDPDEIEEEQREREKRNKINADFNQFVRRVQVRTVRLQVAGMRHLWGLGWWLPGWGLCNGTG
jgi:nucleosome binding factor SPN SPT16 subunit